MKRFVFLSDTHGSHTEVKVPDGDFLIHTGDFTNHGDLREITGFMAWLVQHPHKNKIIIAGNHDRLFHLDPLLARSLVRGGVTYLEDELCFIDGFSFYGCPWHPKFSAGWVFGLPRKSLKLLEKYRKIPHCVNILLTHSAPHSILDTTEWSSTGIGCELLLQEVVQRIEPQVHAFGHCHGSYGVKDAYKIRFVNSSLVDDSLILSRDPIVLDLEPKEYYNGYSKPDEEGDPAPEGGLRASPGGSVRADTTRSGAEGSSAVSDSNDHRPQEGV